MGLDGEDGTVGFLPNGESRMPGLLNAVVKPGKENLKGMHTLSCTQDGTGYNVYYEDLSKSGTTTPSEFSRANGCYFNQQRYYTSGGLDGAYYALRFYNRALSADEIKINQALDRVRFFGADPDAVSLPDGYRFGIDAGVPKLQRQATVSVEGCGTVSEPVVWLEYNKATNTVHLTATPAPDWKFKKWKGAVVEEDAYTADGDIRIMGDVRAVFSKISGMTVILR